MSITRVSNSQSNKGLHHQQIAQNDIDVTSLAGNAVAALANRLIAKRPRILARFTAEYAGISTSSDRITSAFRTGFGIAKHDADTGIDYVRVRCEMVLMPADSTSAAYEPNMYWTLTDSGGTVTTQGSVHISDRTSVAGDVVPDDFIHVDQVWNLKVNELYTAVLTTTAYARVRSIIIYEEPRVALYHTETSPTTDYCVSPGQFIARSPIQARALQDVWGCAHNVWKRGAVIATFDHGSTAASSTTSTSYNNILDSGVSDWTSVSPGFWFRSRYRGSFASTNIPCEFRVRAKRTTQNGTIVLRKAAGVDLATLNVTSSSYAWVSTTFNLDSSQTEEKLDVLFKTNVAGGTLEVDGMTISEYEA